MFAENSLKGKAGIITGGTSGIGLEIAKVLKKLGADLMVTGRDIEKFEPVKKILGDDVLTTAGDVREEKDIEAQLKAHLDQFGKVDFLINNAAGNFLCPAEGMSKNAFSSVLTIVTLGTFLWSKAVFEKMKENKQGRIINTGTTYAYGHGAYVSHSGAAKAGVMNLTKSLAVEWGPYGITCNMIAPGPVEGTEGVKRLMGNPEMQKAMLGMLPIPRMAKGEEIGSTAAFLLSDMASFITGVVIPVDGGMSLTYPGLIPPNIVKKMMS